MRIRHGSIATIPAKTSQTKTTMESTCCISVDYHQTGSGGRSTPACRVSALRAGDPDYMVIDTNNPITISMDTDREVKAVFNCDSGMEQLFPLLVALGLFAAIRRRR